MSNRSYEIPIRKLGTTQILPFNSPWECRIGLTDYMKMRDLRQFALKYRPQPIAKEEYANGSEPEIPEVPY